MATALFPGFDVETFLAIEFPPETKAELSNGVIRMMAGGSGSHNRIQRNILVALTAKLRGSGCGAYGSDMGVKPHGFSLRYPDVSVFCGREGPENDGIKEFDDPRLVVEVLSPTTREEDIKIKLLEYRAIPGLEAILYVDPEDEQLRLLTRKDARTWLDANLSDAEEIPLPSLGITLHRDDIFTRA